MVCMSVKRCGKIQLLKKYFNMVDKLNTLINNNKYPLFFPVKQNNDLPFPLVCNGANYQGP